MANPYLHVAPDEADIERNKAIEPEGERLREELISWLRKNKIVSIRLDTPEHVVDIDVAHLPSAMKPVLRLWGSIFVRDDNNPVCTMETRALAEQVVEAVNLWKLGFTHGPPADQPTEGDIVKEPSRRFSSGE